MKELIVTLTLFITFCSFSQSNEKLLLAEQFWFKGNAKLHNNDTYGAISEYSKAIKVYPNYVTAYLDRGVAKASLGDHKGALIDVNKAIELKPQIAYYDFRAQTKLELKDYYGSIADFTKSLEMFCSQRTYYNRGIVKYRLGDSNGACLDMKKALKSCSIFDESDYRIEKKAIEWMEGICE